MTQCKVDLLPLEEAGEAAEAVGLVAAFADLNIFRVLLHRPATGRGDRVGLEESKRSGE